ncbi:target of EGR1 protein 1-like [Dermatophagoides pteronyssinus]|uniref:target of EGR1 protein 1-like n=1 Tax=Dermatophagoides pteronyssinus TaxID=6956 RepID=UPI003F66FA47
MAIDINETSNEIMMMAQMKVPCIMIDNDNFVRWWPSITKCMQQSDFIAIDLELSGLGSKDIFASQIDERYKAIRNAAITRSILSMGIACYKIDSNNGYFKQRKSNDDEHKLIMEQIADCLEADDELSNDSFNKKIDEETNDKIQFHTNVNVFHFLTLNHSEFVMETRSMKFLVQQGFDFNELSIKGIPFYPGNDGSSNESSSSSSSSKSQQPSLRRLIELLISLKLPLLLHNGFIDLAFLYHNFYAEIPTKLETFMADLTEMFPNGIFDTKYIAVAHLSCSYLEYLFQFAQRSNYFRKLKNSLHMVLKFDHYDDQSDIRIFDLSPKIMQHTTNNGYNGGGASGGVSKICEPYAKYGWCEKADRCELSHNIDLILDEELRSQKNSKSKQLIDQLLQIQQSNQDLGDNNSTINNNNNNDNNSDEQINCEMTKEPLHKKIGIHHAGNDAFMTGYYFIYNLITNHKLLANIKEFRKLNELSRYKNKIFLSSKPRPLNVMKSAYNKCSKGHREKLANIKKKYNLT